MSEAFFRLIDRLRPGAPPPPPVPDRPDLSALRDRGNALMRTIDQIVGLDRFHLTIVSLRSFCACNDTVGHIALVQNDLTGEIASIGICDACALILEPILRAYEVQEST
jgi:hypothetical protein